MANYDSDSEKQAPRHPLHPITGDSDAFTPGEYAAHLEDMRMNGQRVPAVLWRGQIVDGQHRANACAELGIELKIIDITDECPTDEMMRAYVATLNQYRRSRTVPLSNEEKRQRVEAALKADPARSDRAIGQEVGVHHETVAAARNRVADSATPESERKSCTGKKGEGAKRGNRKAPPRKPKPQSTAAPATEPRQERPAPTAEFTGKFNPAAPEATTAPDSPFGAAKAPSAEAPEQETPDLAPDPAANTDPSITAALPAEKAVIESVPTEAEGRIQGPALVTMLGALVTRMDEQGLGDKDLPQLLAAKPLFNDSHLRELATRLYGLADGWKRHEQRVTKASKKVAAGNADLSDMPLFSKRESVECPDERPVGGTTKHS